MSPRALAGPCTVKHCPKLGKYAGRCEDHKQTTSQRDYGAGHQAERLDWQRRIDSGETVLCRRCKQPIPPGTTFDLGHPLPKAPEHVACNRSTMGRDRST